MHKDLPEWYRQAGIAPVAEELSTRWAAIEEYVPTREDIVALTQLFYRFGKPSDTFVSTFVDRFRKTDPVFKARDNQHELSLLAGIELVDVFERGETQLADVTALALISFAAQNLRPDPMVKDIPERAVRYLGERSINRGTVEKNEGESDTSFELRRLAQRLSLVSEECNMLWWLLSEFSRDEEQPWKNFSAPAITLMAGKELSDLTSLLPGPNAALAFLDRIIRCAKSELLEAVSIKEAVNQVSLQWRQRYAERYSFAPLENLLPLGEAIKLSTISQKKNAWETMFKEKTGISASAKISHRKLSYQVFIETQLCRCYEVSAA